MNAFTLFQCTTHHTPAPEESSVRSHFGKPCWMRVRHELSSWAGSLRWSGKLIYESFCYNVSRQLITVIYKYVAAIFILGGAIFGRNTLTSTWSVSQLRWRGSLHPCFTLSSYFANTVLCWCKNDSIVYESGVSRASGIGVARSLSFMTLPPTVFVTRGSCGFPFLYSWIYDNETLVAKVWAGSHRADAGGGWAGVGSFGQYFSSFSNEVCIDSTKLCNYTSTIYIYLYTKNGG